MTCAHLPATGDRGQRYEVRAQDRGGREFVIGWTEAADGGALLRLAGTWPHCKPGSGRVIDRRPGTG